MVLNVWGHPVTREDVGRMVPPGWKKLVLKLVDELEVAGWSGQLSQVKEKFGGLRFYAEEQTEAMESMISEAEGRSYRICQDCGHEGDDVKHHNSGGVGWVVTHCHNCNLKERKLKEREAK